MNRVLDTCFGVAGSNLSGPTFSVDIIIFYSWIVFIELFRYNSKQLFLNFISNLKEICPELCYLRKFLIMDVRYMQYRRKYSPFHSIHFHHTQEQIPTSIEHG